jgi:hypothetical protein
MPLTRQETGQILPPTAINGESTALRTGRAAHERYEHHQTHGWASVLCLRARSISTLIIEARSITPFGFSARYLRKLPPEENIGVVVPKIDWIYMCPRVQIGCCT